MLQLLHHVQNRDPSGGAKPEEEQSNSPMMREHPFSVTVPKMHDVAAVDFKGPSLASPPRDMRS